LIDFYHIIVGSTAVVRENVMLIKICVTHTLEIKQGKSNGKQEQVKANKINKKLLKGTKTSEEH
jgi:hypothetical protein